MIESLRNSVKMIVAKGAVAAGQTEVADAAIVDLQGFDSVCFVAVLGADTASGAVTTLKASCGDNSALSDAALKTKTATHTATSATSDDDKLLVLDVIRPGRRYVRPVVTRGTANAAISCVLAFVYNADNVPVPLSADVLAAAVSVN